MSLPWWLPVTGLFVAASLFAGMRWWSVRARRWVVLRRPAVRAGDDDSGIPWFRGGGWRGVRDRLLAAPRRTLLVVAALAALLGAFAGGPVAAVVAAAYGGLAVRALIRRVTVRAAERAHRRQLDALGGLAADLRAGQPVPAALTGGPLGDGPSVAGASGDGRLVELTRAAARLAEQTGAPLADLVERIEADARAMDRALATAMAQAAGARATAWLLAGLPLGGLALGYGIGVDPLRVLLHTPIGAGCAIGAIVLQLAGLAWAYRLSTGPGRAG